MSVLFCQVKYKGTFELITFIFQELWYGTFEAIITILLALARTSVDSVSLINGKASMNMYQLFTDLLIY